MRTLALLVSLALLPAACAAQESSCDEAAFKVAARFAGFKDFSDEGDDARVAASVCKPAPDQPGVLLAAFAYSTEPAGKPIPEYDVKDVAVLMIDRAHERVIASYKLQASEDAITKVGRDSLRLDTARYLLAPGVRAFGLRMSSAAMGPSCPDNSYGDWLALFVPDGRALRPVLQLNMATAHAIAGCLNHPGPDGVGEAASLTIALAPTRSKGYADLVVRAAIDAWAGDDAKDRPKPRTETRTLHYDGQHYALPTGDAGPWWLADTGF